MFACGGGPGDYLADKSSRRSRTAVAHTKCLMLGATSPPFDISNLDRAVCRIPKAIDPQALAALGFQSGLERQKHQERDDVVRRQIVPFVKLMAEPFRREAMNPSEIGRANV